MKNTLDILRLTCKIIESWDGNEPSQIEKDIVVDNLRKAYERVKFGNAESEPLTVAGQPGNEREPEQVPVVPPVEVTRVPSSTQEDDHAGQPSSIVNSPDEKEEFAENILFTPEEMPAKAKFDKKVILSLYGDDPMPVKAEEKNDLETKKENMCSAEKSLVGQSREEIAEPVQVMAEVIGQGGQTVADVYSENSTTTDIASVLSSGKVDGIRKSIGINDKFLIIRSLFDGDSETYERVISELDGFDDLDQALIYIHENFSWNPDDEAVKLIVDLLTRKLS
ncbi:MAG: hypothetical protein LIO77_06780 [Rikenellaceae bacterium]|nr:hypothetical protein [Rikenellaceae bacterium]